MRRASLLLGLLPLAGCGEEDPPPAWSSLLTAERRVSRGAPDAVDGLELESSSGGRWIRTRVEDGAWSARTVGSGRTDFWATNSPLLGTPIDADGTPLFRLYTAGGEYRCVGSTRSLEDLERGTFTVFGRRLVARSVDGSPPRRATLERRVADAHGDRLLGQRFACDALVVEPGDRVSLRFRARPGSVLRFGTVFAPALHPGLARDARVRYRVTLDGRELAATTLPYGEEPELVWHALPLPEGTTEGRLGFSVQGPLAHAAFALPTVGPAPGESAEEGARRPDLVLFLADTFRADNLAAYGSTRGLTPSLDAFAERGRVFARAYSTASFTLPAHASLFTGLHPHQAGILGDETALARRFATLAETLRRGGYRTAAVTDGLFVSRVYGLDEGFEVFDELHGDLASTLERAADLLEADDGRPLFLFVQTYRTHMPYRVDDELRAALAGRVTPPRRSSVDLNADFEALSASEPDGPARRARRAELAAALRASYLATVFDLDRGWARFEALLHRDGPRYVLFTSDHGEAFDEHGVLFHGGRGFEEQVRVPLVLAGPGVEPGVEAAPVSLVDVPRTLVELAGLEPPAAWGGRSLLDPDPARALFAFECDPRGDAVLTVVEGERKVFAPEDAERLGPEGAVAAYDLGADPGESRDLHRLAAWPRETLARHAARLAVLLTPLGAVEAPVRDASHLEALRAMGYAGGE